MLNNASSDLEYFAATDDPIKLADSMTEKIRQWRQWCDGNGYTGLWKKKFANYYGTSLGGNTSHGVVQGGTEGELSMIKVNDLHSLIQQQLVLVTGQRPAGIAKAVNSDTKSLKSARIGTALAEFYMNDAGFEDKFITAAEIALVFDEAFLELFWDKSQGEPIAVDPETGDPEMSGDVVLRVHTPWHIARDPGLPIDEQEWFIVSFKMNKFSAANTYPKFRDKIISSQDADFPALAMDSIPAGSDAIFCHLLIHDRKSSVPTGRYSLLIGDQIVLDSELPYKDFPIERIAPADIIDGPIGYSAANDILALEEVTDALHSIAVTNQTKYGGNCIIGPEGASFNPTDLAKGSRYVQVPPDMVDKIKTLDLLKTPPEVFNYMTMLGTKKDQAVGANSVTRGNPEGQLAGASGAALALIAAQAISFNSGIQKNYFRLLSGVMTKFLGILRMYADSPKVIEIVGKTKGAGLKQFKYTGHDLNAISSIVYEMVNPISQTLGGRLTLAQDLLKAGQIKSPKQYINLVTTGQPDVLLEDDEADGLLILEENEWLMEGKPFKAIITQMHADHIKSHTSQITLESTVSDPDFVGRVLSHIQEHIDIWQKASAMNPGILMATGQQPLQPPPQGLPQQQPSPAGGAPSPGSAVPPGAPQGIHPPPAPPMHPQALHAVGPNTGGGVPPALQKAAQTREAHLPNMPIVAGTRNSAIVPGVTDAGLS